MAYVQPNSDIEFFANLSLSPDYQDTLFFESVSAKNSYFNALEYPYKIAYAHSCYYVRENRNMVRVEIPMSTLIGAEYMRFKNTLFENKWWYAFVVDVNYINNNTTEVTFQMDYIMSWMGEFYLNECYVERQHTLTDNIGDNITDENLAIGEYVTNKRKRILGDDGNININSPNYWEYLILVSPGGTYVPYSHGGLYSGFAFESVRGLTNTSDLEDKITEITESTFIPWSTDPEKIQGIQIIPSAFSPTQFWDNTLPYFGEQGPYEYEENLDIRHTNLDGYEPKNNKLYTFPFNFLRITNGEGSEHVYKYEFFKDRPNNLNVQAIRFNAVGLCGVKAEIALIPLNYKLGEHLKDETASTEPVGYKYPCYEEQLTMMGFPQVAWSVDTFKAYFAQYMSGVAIETTNIAEDYGKSQLLNYLNNDTGSMEFLTGRVTGEISAISKLAKEAVEPVVKSSIASAIKPRLLRGRATTDLMVALLDKDFYAHYTSINAKSAEIIDNYFTMFGYADKTVHQPSMNARPHWTYVKTIGCKITCACPASDAEVIENAFNRGVRFWKNHTEIGNYSLDNSPIT